jgi:uncharacterized lipoprotein YajG
MIRAAAIAAVLLLTGCETTKSYLNCDNADAVKAAAQAAINAIDYACPVPSDSQWAQAPVHPAATASH